MKAPARKQPVRGAIGHSDASGGGHTCSCALGPPALSGAEGEGDAATPAGFGRTETGTTGRTKPGKGSSSLSGSSGFLWRSGPTQLGAGPACVPACAPSVAGPALVKAPSGAPTLLPCPVRPSGSGVVSQPRLCTPGSWARLGRSLEALPSFVTSGTTLWTQEDPSP